MRTRIVLVALCLTLAWSLSLIAGARAQTKSVDTELQKFQGTWVMIAAEMDGKAVHDAHVNQSKITFAGDKVELFTPHQHTEVIVATVVKLETGKNPKEMHWIRANGPKAGATVVSIYEFEGADQYKISFDPAGVTVPKKFSTEVGSGHIWHAWKRLTP